MATTDASSVLGDETLSVILENIGGIKQATHEIPPGVTALKGENATNRSSFLQGIMGVLGGDTITLNSSAESGKATIKIGDETYTRTLSRNNGHVQKGGSPYLNGDDARAAKLYAFLTEENPIRRAVENGDDLTELLLDPVDKKEIEAKQRRLRQKRDDLRSDIDNAVKAADAVIKLEEQETNIEAEIEAIDEEIAELEAEIETLREEAKGTDNQEEHSKLQDNINDKKSKIAEYKSTITTKEEAIEEKKDAIEALNIPDISRQELETQRTELENKKAELEERRTELDDLQGDVTAAQRLNQNLADNSVSIPNIISTVDAEESMPDGPLTGKKASESPGELTDKLTGSEQVLCHACGSQVLTKNINLVQEQYKQLNIRLSKEINSLNDRIADIDGEIADITSTLDDHADAQERKNSYQDDINRLEEQIDTAEKKVSELEDEVDELQEQQAALDPDPVNKELGKKREEKGNKEATRRQKENKLSRIEAEIERKEEMAEREDEFRAQRDDVIEKLEEVNGKIEQIEMEIVEEFDERMQTVLQMLGYDNIARVRFDRLKKETPGRGNDTETEFNMVITRDDGRAYEESLDNLSESERNIIGLMVALTGYLVHDVYETCPVMLFDSIEMIDSTRLAEIIDYFSEYQEYLVAALLPEDAATIDGSGVNVINW
jgi:predicted  nucleic acid-binding Zn-ribbon protein